MSVGLFSGRSFCTSTRARDVFLVPCLFWCLLVRTVARSQLRTNRTGTAGPSQALHETLKKTCHVLKKMAATAAQKRRWSEQTMAMPDKDAKRREEEPTEQLLEVEASSVDFEEVDMRRAGVSISAASVTYALKAEDRHSVLRLPDDSRFGEC